MDMKACRFCGNTKNLVPDGKQWRCEWEHGCQHRQLRQDATMQRLAEALAENDPPSTEHYVCGHTYDEHVGLFGKPMADLFDTTWDDVRRLMGFGND